MIQKNIVRQIYIIVALTLTLFFFASTSSAATRLVVNTAPDTGQGSGGCTSVGNNCSLSRALSQANPNDTIELRVASYNANGRTYTINRNNLIIRSQTGYTYTISNFAAGGTAFTVPASGVTFQNLILNGGSSTGTGISIGGNNAVINTMTLQNFTVDALNISGAAATVQSTTIEGSGTGIKSSSNNLTVTNSTIKNNTNYGVWFNNVKKNKIENSTIDNNNKGVYWLDSDAQNDANRNELINTTISNNATYGVWVQNSKFGNIQGSTINNNGKGVVLYGADVRLVYLTQNSIYQNGSGGQGMGIDFNNDGVTTNNGDSNEAGMPNNGVDYPVIKEASLSGDTLMLKGCTPSNATVEFFKRDNADPSSYGGNCSYTSGLSCSGLSCSDTDTDCSGFGQGKVYLGSLSAGADGCFSGTIDVTGKGLTTNDKITATATISGRGTSEFSRSVYSTRIGKISIIHWKEVVQ